MRLAGIAGSRSGGDGRRCSDAAGNEHLCADQFYDSDTAHGQCGLEHKRPDSQRPDSDGSDKADEFPGLYIR